MTIPKYYKYSLAGDHILELQRKLNHLGYSLKEDGIFGIKTQKAIIDFESDISYFYDSSSFSVDPRTLQHLECEFNENKETTSLYPKGKGMFVRHSNHFRSVSELKQKIEEANLSWICMRKIRQYKDSPDVINRNMEEWIETLEETGCDLWIWGWPLPEEINSFVEVMEEACESWGANGIIADIEGNFYNKEKESEELARLLNNLGVPTGITSFGAPWNHKRFPFEIFSSLDFGIPQIYEMGDNDFPDDFPEKCMAKWKELGYNHLLPASSAFLSREDEMVDLLERTPITDSVIWWDWHNANLRNFRWEKIKEYRLPN